MLDAKKEDILRVQKSDKDNDDNLPNIIRDLILHDRGNSLFLGDSFANLPSPVNESQTIKQFFKPKGDQEEDGLKLKKKDNNEKEDGVKIKIEGKELLNDSTDKKSIVNINIRDIERIVFNNNTKKDIEKQRQMYQEEESYINPSNNISYQSEDDQTINSFIQTMKEKR